MSPLGAALAGCIAFAGIALAIAGWRGVLPTPVRTGRRADDLSLRLALGAVGLVLGIALTRWPVAAGYLAFAGSAVPALLRSKRERRQAVARVEALAAWTESLRDIMGAGVGLHQTLRASARVAPAAIEDEVRSLSLRLEHESVDTALVKFAADLAHPTADIVVASLLLASRWQAGGLPDVLSSVARAARDAAAMKQRIEGSRERTYTQSRIVAGTSTFFILFLVLFRRDFLSPYDSLGGQIAQLVIGGMFAFAGYGMHRLGRPQIQVRVFGRLERMARGTPSGMRAR